MVKAKIRRHRAWPASRTQGSQERVITKLLREVWGLHRTVGKNEQFYLEHYNNCAAPLSIRRDLLAPSSPDDFLDMVNFVKQRVDKTLCDIKQDILTQDPTPQWLVVSTDEAARAAMDFAVNLWLMVDTGSWTESITLREYVATLFPKAKRNVSPVALPQEDLNFNARKLHRIAALEIVLTSEITKHLVLDRRHSKLYVFRLASMLHSHGNASTNKVYPEGLLAELSETMALLFPSTDSSRRNWDRRMWAKADLDVENGLVRHNVNSYVFWQDRLKTIQDYYDNSRPRTIRQWIYDSRDGNQQATFWFAVMAIMLTLLFGLIQSITGIVQVTQS